jgi:death-on-curing protein
VIYYLSTAQVSALHKALVERFGGLAGVRDKGALESAVVRPAMTFGGEDLYPDIAAKAAAVMHSLVLNHPFSDGNKRVGVAAAELFVLVNGWELQADDTELEDLTLAVARGEMDIEPLIIWFRQRLVQQG